MTPTRRNMLPPTLMHLSQRRLSLHTPPLSPLLVLLLLGNPLTSPTLDLRRPRPPHVLVIVTEVVAAVAATPNLLSPPSPLPRRSVLTIPRILSNYTSPRTTPLIATAPSHPLPPRVGNMTTIAAVVVPLQRTSMMVTIVIAPHPRTSMANVIVDLPPTNLHVQTNHPTRRAINHVHSMRASSHRLSLKFTLVPMIALLSTEPTPVVSPWMPSSTNSTANLTTSATLVMEPTPKSPPTVYLSLVDPMPETWDIIVVFH